jgi:hypothetical protein
MHPLTTLSVFRRKLVFLVYILLSGAPGVFSQPINYSNTLDSVKVYLEKNYAGFTDKVNAQTQNDYEAHARLSYQYAKQAQTATDGYFAIHHFLTFFKDQHLYISPNANTRATEKILLDDKQIQRLYHSTATSIEGIYYSSDSAYKVALVKNKKGLRTYAGVILTAKPSSWKKGQVKFELIETEPDQYMGIWYNRSHSLSLTPIHFNPQNGLGDEGWYKYGASLNTEPAPTPLFTEETQVNAFFKILNDSTGYLRIKSFNASENRHIDSVINANAKSIQSMPKLVIDLRGNGGGSDRSMSLLMPVLYTNPVKNIGVDLLSTPDNTTAWDLLIDGYRNKLSKDQLDNLSKRIHQQDGNERTTINFRSDYTGTLPAVWAYPAKVAIVIDSNCASATEEFLLFARQSQKTIMAGEHSMGVLDYSNVVPKGFSHPPFTLHYPTTRSRRIDAGLGIDNIGIQPDLSLDLNGNWLDELLKNWPQLQPMNNAAQ